MVERIYQILKIIKNSKEPISAKDIKAKLEENNIYVDIKTIYSSIKMINEYFGLLVNNNEYIKGIKRKGYCIENSYFDDGQMQFLIDSITSNPNLNNTEANELISKLSKLSNRNQIDSINLSLNNHHQNYSLITNLTTLLSAINNHHNIYFKYINYQIEDNGLIEVTSKNGNYKHLGEVYYIVSPYKIVLRNSHYYLVGYYDKRPDQLSMYRLDRMRLVRRHNSTFIDREQYDLNQELNNVNMYLSDTKATLTFRFSNHILREVVNQFGQDIEVKKDVNNHNIAIIEDVAISEGLIGWIMMLQEQIEVITPFSLRQTISERIKKMSELYQETL